MKRKIVLVHQQLDEIFGFLLFDVLLPDTENVYATTLKIWPLENILVVPISLTVIKTHQAWLFENVVASDDLNNLRMRWNTLESFVADHAIILFLIFV